MRRLLVPLTAGLLLIAGCADPAGSASSVTEGGAGSDASVTEGGAGSDASGSVSSDAASGPGSRSGSAPVPSSDTGSPRLTNIAPIAPGEPAQVGPSQVDSSAIPGGFDGRVTTADDGITVVGTEGSCSRVSADLLGEDADTVRVQLTLTTTSPGPCTAIAKLVPLTVQLAAPLEARTIVLTQVER